MAQIKQSPKLPAEVRRAQLLASAKKLFVKKGYRSTTIEEIARNAGLTKGAVYFHFKNKEDILYGLVRAISEQHDAAAAKMFKPNMKPSEFFLALTKTHEMSDLSAYGELVDIWVQAFRIPRIKKYIASRIRRFLKMYEDCVDPMYAGNHRLLQEMGLLTFGLHDGLSVLRLISPRLVDIDAQARLFESHFDHPAIGSVRKGSR